MKVLLPPFKQWLTTIINDFIKFSFNEFIKEQHYLHFFICAIISYFSDYPLLMGMFVTGLAVFREFYFHTKSKDKETPFSWADIRWTYYGCILTYLIKFIL